METLPLSLQAYLPAVPVYMLYSKRGLEYSRVGRTGDAGHDAWHKGGLGLMRKRQGSDKSGWMVQYSSVGPDIDYDVPWRTRH